MERRGSAPPVPSASALETQVLSSGPQKHRETGHHAIPPNLWSLIFLQLDVEDLLSVSLVCSEFYALCRHALIIRCLENLRWEGEVGLRDNKLLKLHVMNERPRSLRMMPTPELGRRKDLSRGRAELSPDSPSRMRSHTAVSGGDASPQRQDASSKSKQSAARRSSTAKSLRKIPFDVVVDDIKQKLRRDSQSVPDQFDQSHEQLFRERCESSNNTRKISHPETYLAVPEVICRRRSFSANSAAEKSRIPAVDSTKTRLGPVVEWSEEEEVVGNDDEGGIMEERTRSVPHTPDLLGERRRPFRLVDGLKTTQNRSMREFSVALDLSHMQLGQLTPDQTHVLQYFKGLEELWMEDNELWSLPTGFRNLQSLLILHLSHNRFESIPVDVIMLGHLQYLEMSHNAVTMVSSKIGLMASLKILDLSNNQLSELPDSIGRLENLEMLLLSHNRFLQVPPCLMNLLSLRDLALRNNQLRSIPTSLKKIDTLEAVDVRDNEILIMPNLGDNIQVMFDGNPLMTSATENEVLQQLDLSYRELDARIPSLVCSYSSLRILDLSHNNLNDIPFEIRQLAQLSQADFSFNRFEFIPLPLTTLPQLIDLNMSNNRMKVLRIAPAPGACNDNLFPQLKQLDISRNQVKHLLIDVAEYFHSLVSLDISGNCLEKIAAHTPLPSSLRVLDLSANKLVNISGLRFPKRFRELRVSDNKLDALPHTLANCEDLCLLDVDNNPLSALRGVPTGPQDVADLLSFVRRMKDDLVKGARLKMVIMGPQHSGKTALLRALKGTRGADARMKHMISRSTGVSIKEWHASENLTFSAWTLPESDVHYYCMPIFDSNHVFYILVFSMADLGAMHIFFNQMRMIQSRCPNAQVFLVGTHQDKRSSPEFSLKLNQALTDVRQEMEMDETSDVPFRMRWVINDAVGEMDSLQFFPISTSKGTGLNVLRQKVIDNALTSQVMKSRFPGMFQSLVSMIESKRKDMATPIIGIDTMVEWVTPIGMDATLLRQGLRTLNDWGVILYYDEDVLSEHVILDPLLLSAVVNAIVSVDSAKSRKGVVSSASLISRWTAAGLSLSPHRYKFWFELIVRHEVVLPLRQPLSDPANQRSSNPHSGHIPVSPLHSFGKFLVPSLLPDKAPDKVASSVYRYREGMLCRQFDFPRLPRNFFERMIARVMQFTTAQTLWKDCAIFRMQDENVVLRIINNPSNAVLTSNAAQRTLLVVTAFSFTADVPTTIFRMTICSLETFCADWYAGLRFHVTCCVPCIGCLKQRSAALSLQQDEPVDDLNGSYDSSGATTPSTLSPERTGPLGEQWHVFDAEDCIRLYMSGEMTAFDCPICESSIKAVSLIPELSNPFAGMGTDNVPVDYHHPVEGKTLGEGSYAVVYESKFKVYGRPVTPVAVKQMRPFMVSLPTLVEFQSEVHLLKMADHPNMVKLFHSFSRPPSIITEYLGHGSLEKYVYPATAANAAKAGQVSSLPSSRKVSRVPSATNSEDETISSSLPKDSEISASELAASVAPSTLDSTSSLSYLYQLRIASDIAHAINALHSRPIPILHRDIKSANVLVVDLDPETPCVVKLCDLGLACVYSGYDSRGKNDNPRWTAPEVIQGKPYTTKSDVYSFAMLLYEVVAGRVPFGDDNFEFFVEQRVTNGDRPSLPDTVPASFAKLIRSCWHADPTKRPSFEEMIPRLGRMIEAERKRSVEAKRWTGAIPRNIGKSRSASLGPLLSPLHPNPQLRMERIIHDIEEFSVIGRCSSNEERELHRGGSPYSGSMLDRDRTPPNRLSRSQQHVCRSTSSTPTGRDRLRATNNVPTLKSRKYKPAASLLPATSTPNFSRQIRASSPAMQAVNPSPNWARGPVSPARASTGSPKAPTRQSSLTLGLRSRVENTDDNAHRSKCEVSGQDQAVSSVSSRRGTASASDIVPVMLGATLRGVSSMSVEDRGRSTLGGDENESARAEMVIAQQEAHRQALVSLDPPKEWNGEPTRSLEPPVD